MSNGALNPSALSLEEILDEVVLYGAPLTPAAAVVVLEKYERRLRGMRRAVRTLADALEAHEVLDEDLAAIANDALGDYEYSGR